MRKIDDGLALLGMPRMFFELPDRGFVSEYDWGTLMHLINEDYDDLIHRPPRPHVASAARWLFERMDKARAKVGITRFIGDLPVCFLTNTVLSYTGQGCMVPSGPTRGSLRFFHEREVGRYTRHSGGQNCSYRVLPRW